MKSSCKNLKAHWANLMVFICVIGLSGCRIVSEPAEIKVYDPEPSSMSSSSEGRTVAFLGSTTGARTETEGEQTGRIVCEIKGHIVNPGVYELEAGSRVHDLVKMAGGPSKSGSLDLVNQARALEDGEAVLVPSHGTTKEEYAAMALGASAPSTKGSGSSALPGQVQLIDINSADRTLLETIPNIGSVMAQNIIDYRNAHGPFSVIEDLKNVSRIGEKTFEKIKPYVTVSP